MVRSGWVCRVSLFLQAHSWGVKLNALFHVCLPGCLGLFGRPCARSKLVTLTQRCKAVQVVRSMSQVQSNPHVHFLQSHCMCSATLTTLQCYILLIIHHICAVLLRLLGSCMHHMKSVTSSLRLGIGSNPLGVCPRPCSHQQPHRTAAAAASLAALPRPFWRLLCQAAAGPQVRTPTRPAVQQKSRPAKAAGPAGAAAAASDTWCALLQQIALPSSLAGLCGWQGGILMLKAAADVAHSLTKQLHNGL
jgi:hypothetical protein